LCISSPELVFSIRVVSLFSRSHLFGIGRLELRISLAYVGSHDGCLCPSRWWVGRCGWGLGPVVTGFSFDFLLKSKHFLLSFCLFQKEKTTAKGSLSASIQGFFKGWLVFRFERCYRLFFLLWALLFYSYSLRHHAWASFDNLQG
jgi:hypothetical protein